MDNPLSLIDHHSIYIVPKGTLFYARLWFTHITFLRNFELLIIYMSYGNILGPSGTISWHKLYKWLLQSVQSCDA